MLKMIGFLVALMALAGCDTNRTCRTYQPRSAVPPDWLFMVACMGQPRQHDGVLLMRR